MIDYKYIIVVISIIIYTLLIQHRHVFYFFPNKIMSYTPSDFNIDYSDVNIDKINGWFFSNPNLKKINKQKSDKILIYLHGNAGNISHRIHIIEHLLNIFTDSDIYIYDYPQYGLSSGPLTPSNIISSSYKIYDYWSNKYDKVCLIGESLGASIMAETYNFLNSIHYHNMPSIMIHLNGVTALWHVADNILPFIVKPFVIPWITEFNSEKIYYQNIHKLPTLLIIHSERDDIVPIKHVKHMINNLKLRHNIHFIKVDGIHTDPIFDDKSITKIKKIYDSC